VGGTRDLLPGEVARGGAGDDLAQPGIAHGREGDRHFVRRLGGHLAARDGARKAPLGRPVDGGHGTHLKAQLPHVDAVLPHARA